MNNYGKILLIILSLVGCDKKPSKPPEGSQLYWTYGFTAPQNYQADIAFVTAFIGKDQELRLMTGGSTGGHFLGEEGNFFKPDTAPSMMDQSATIEPPDAVLVNWYSMQEGQYYAVLVKLDEKARKRMTQVCKPDGPQSMDDYMNNILIGLAPGGYSRAWLRGPCQSPIEIGHFKGWKVNANLSTGEHRDINSEYMQRYRNRMKDVINKPIPYENWE